MSENTPKASDRKEVVVPNQPQAAGDKEKDAALYRTAADEFDIDQGDMTHHGLSHGIGLEEIPGSKVPGAGHLHVSGPQQAAVDPHAAGLDLESRPVSRNANRAIHRTGPSAGGNRPGNRTAAQDGVPDDGSVVAAQPDKEASKRPGPSG